jgi:protein-tyrosine phosphatase
MDENNFKVLDQVKVRFGFPNKEIYLMRDFTNHTKGLSVPDPYYGGEEAFEEIYQILDEAIENFLNKVIVIHQLYV